MGSDLGKIRTAVGSAQLLMAQKFYQFKELCEENLNPNAHPRPTSQDLVGFWDMLQLSIENISMKFDELHQLKANNLKQMDPLDKKVEQCRFCMVHLKTCTNTGQFK